MIEIALELFEKLYVHLPLKRSMYAVNPIQALKLLRRKLEAPSAQMKDREFFNSLLSVFCELRDLHTTFVLPEPFRSRTAYLPFRLEKCGHGVGVNEYVVSHVMPESGVDPNFKRGSIVTHWNGTPIDRAVAANANREAGSNPAARLAQGLSALTIRWLGTSLLPDEEWVSIRFRPAPNAPPLDARFEWKVFQRKAEGEAATAIARAQRHNVWAVGMDARGESERQIRRHLFDEGRRQAPQFKASGDSTGAVAEWAREVFPTCGNVPTTQGGFA